MRWRNDSFILSRRYSKKASAAAMMTMAVLSGGVRTCGRHRLARLLGVLRGTAAGAKDVIGLTHTALRVQRQHSV